MNSASSKELIKAARQYLERGWRTVYIEPGTKKPNRKDWQMLRLSEEDFSEAFGRSGNIGIILGEASGGVVDTDIDCPEGLAIADEYLPLTGAETGRPGALRSHRWYCTDLSSTVQFRDPVTNDMIIELRSTGGQTLVGPSIHESGEPYDWLDG
ncbi:MAG: bifunctional DNA primase/polymerase, partial [Planctomycetota bacterium]|nr:bifunctional DNA primase/polymerase [Planctomycetota bacterium]